MNKEQTFVILILDSGVIMEKKDILDLSSQILIKEKERINNSHWADLTLQELDLIDDIIKRKEYRKSMNEFHMRIINTFSAFVSKDFKFSVSKDKLTYRIMANDYMNYFYNKGMTREQIIEMLSNSKTTFNEGKQK